jgi:hypothetical protein
MAGKASDYKKSFYINIGVILTVVALFVLFFILLRLNILREASIISDIKLKKAFVSESAENLSSLVKDWAIVKNYSQQVSLLVPSKDDLVALSKDINAIARQDNVSLSFNFGSESNPTGAGALGSISFTATADGSMANVLAFLKDIENKYYALKANVLELSRPSSGLTRLSLNGQIFYEVK